MRLVARVLAKDRNSEAVAAEARELLVMKPDFETSGRRLIRNYVKFPELRQRIESGLGGAGISMKA